MNGGRDRRWPRLRLPRWPWILRGPAGPLRSAQAAAGTAPAWLAAAWAIAMTDLRIWLRRPWQVIGTLFVPVSYTLVAVLGSAATAANPVAVVNADHGAAGAQIAAAIVNAQVFRVHEVSAADARQMYAGNQVAAIITIPAGTTAVLAAGGQVHVGLQVNNVDSDLAQDVRRGTQDAIIAWYQHRASPWPVNVDVAEQTMLTQDVQLYQYSILPVIILVTTVSGILVAGMVAAREFERRTVKGLLLAPVPRAVIIGGKMTAGWVFTSLTAALVLAAGAALGWTRPASLAGWAEALAAITLASLFVAGLGVAIGTWGRRAQPVSISATIVAVELFALSGGLGVIFFEPGWLQAIAQFDPLTYAIHALQGAVFYQSTAGWGRDVTVLVAAAAAAAAAGTIAMRRGLIRLPPGGSMTAGLFAGRGAIAAVFVHGGCSTLADAGPREQAAAALLARARAAAPWLPPDRDLVRLNAAVHVAAGLALAAGIRQRQAAAVLALSLIPTTLAGHPFWEPGPGQQGELIAAVKNAGLFGGLLLLAAAPPATRR